MERTLPATWRLTLPWPRILWAVRVLSVVGLAVMWAALQPHAFQGDAHNYWMVDLPHSYEIGWNVRGGFVYSPAFAQIIGPLTLLPWAAFYAIWTALLIIAVAWLISPPGACLAFILFPPVFADVASGNIHAFMAVVAVLSFRAPWLWSFILLTKVTPGVGLLWYVGRREWKRLGIALLATMAVVVVSFTVAPRLWPAWGAMLAAAPSAPHLWQVVDLPLPLRLAGAAGLALYAGAASRRWLLPVVLLIAMPSIWLASLTVLLAIPRMWLDHARLADPYILKGRNPLRRATAVVADSYAEVGRRHG